MERGSGTVELRGSLTRRPPLEGPARGGRATQSYAAAPAAILGQPLRHQRTGLTAAWSWRSPGSPRLTHRALHLPPPALVLGRLHQRCVRLLPYLVSGHLCRTCLLLAARWLGRQLDAGVGPAARRGRARGSVSRYHLIIGRNYCRLLLLLRGYGQRTAGPERSSQKGRAHEGGRAQQPRGPGGCGRNATAWSAAATAAGGWRAAALKAAKISNVIIALPVSADVAASCKERKTYASCKLRCPSPARTWEPAADSQVP